jgi:antitoxin HicB
MPALLEHAIRREASDLKHIVSSGLRTQLKRRGTSRAALARELGTSRSAVDRMLDEKNTSITLHTLVRAASTLGYRLELRMEPRIDKVEEVKAPARLKPLLRKLGAALDKLPTR